MLAWGCANVAFYLFLPWPISAEKSCWNILLAKPKRPSVADFLNLTYYPCVMFAFSVVVIYAKICADLVMIEGWIEETSKIFYAIKAIVDATVVCR